MAAVETDVDILPSHGPEPDVTVLLHVGDGWLALDAQELKRAFDRGRQLTWSTTSSATMKSESTKGRSRVVDAEAMQALTGVPSTWFLDMARMRRIPHLRFGKYVRFDVTEVLSQQEVRERAKGRKD